MDNKTLGVDAQYLLNKTHEQTLQTVKAAAYIGFILSIISLAITGIVLFLSQVIDHERRAFFLGVIVLCGVGLTLIMIVTRGHPTTLLLFTILMTFMSGISMGMTLSIF